MFSISLNGYIGIHTLELTQSDCAHFVKQPFRLKKSGSMEQCKESESVRSKIWKRTLQASYYKPTLYQQDLLNQSPSVPPWLVHLLCVPPCPSCDFSVSLLSNHELCCFVVRWLHVDFSPVLLAPKRLM